MKRTFTTRNRVRGQGTVSVSLFPFLVVLICTMGALILLLVIIARQARLQAAEDTAEQTAAIRKELDAAREWAQLEISEYEYSREKTKAQLADARLALGHVEDHARRLRDQLAQLQATWSELEALEAEGADRREGLEAELARLKGAIAQAERELAEAREAARRRESYAVVPYEGPNATHRRPIYIECRRDAVVLQPEGVVLSAEDFAGPLGSGNPLDVALRAVREYLLRHRQFHPQDSGEPYPLLLVRPDGIEAYYAARAAMRSWAYDFGYELIGEDWDLEFQSPDPRLAQEVEQAVATARVRQERLLAAAPRRYTRRSPAGYVASPYRGGLIPRGGSDDASPGYGAQRWFDRLDDQFASRDDKHKEPTSGTDASAAGQPVKQPVQTPPFGSTPERPGDNTPPPSDRDAESRVPAPASDRPQSLAKVRGRNWGLPNGVDGWVAITAPVRIDCHPDRLVLVPEKGLGQTKLIPLGTRTEDAVEELISAVWEYVARWGSAGRGMYWRPALSLRVAPGAESRYNDLKILLDQSGLGVERNDE